jgi:predicted MFS family arabinose efflux permease
MGNAPALRQGRDKDVDSRLGSGWRLILGLAVGGLWTFAVAVGRQLVQERAGARATSIISAGISAGTVFGAGAALGSVLVDHEGIAPAFVASAAFALLGTATMLASRPTSDYWPAQI